jgi:DNA-binding PadR family transcriptional regulator
MSLEHLILGILKDEPLSGYDINKKFRYVVEFFWSADQSQIYRALYKMKELGWVNVQTIAQEKNPNKKVYSLTTTGKEELSEWLLQPLESQPSRSLWLGQLFFADDLSNEDICNLLEARITQLKGHLKVLETRLGGHDIHTAAQAQKIAWKSQPTGVITLHYGIEQLKFQIKWAEDTIRLLQAISA